MHSWPIPSLLCAVSLVVAAFSPAFAADAPANAPTTSAPAPAATPDQAPTKPEPLVLRVRAINSSTQYDNNTPAFHAEINDSIMIDVQDLDEWMKRLKSQGLIKDETIANLVPFFNNVAMWGVHPENSGAASDQDPFPNHQYHHLRFTLKRSLDEPSREAWQRILNQPVRNRRVRVSVGFENGAQMDTWVDATDKTGAFQFFLKIIPTWPALLGGAIIGGALVVFLKLASRTDIVRDTTAARRPDGRSPLSLGRVQMAFWFFLIISAFFILWLVMHDLDTISSSALVLMGISAGTALGAAIIDSGKNSADATERYVFPGDLKQPRPAITAQLKQSLQAELVAFAGLQAARAGIAATDVVALSANADQQQASRERQDVLRRQIEFFGWAPWQVVMYDLLADKNVITFHRFQIFVWTLILGIIFMIKVYSELLMPDFSSTLLGLLGISAGTYLGFKLPDKTV